MADVPPYDFDALLANRFLSSVGIVPLVKRQVGTGCFVPNNQNTTPRYANSQKTVYIVEDVGPTNPLYIQHGNWFARGTISSGAETNGPGNITWTASIEYPVGTFTQIKWSGLSSVTTVPGATVECDGITVSVPRGAMVIIHYYQVGVAGILYCDGFNQATNDKFEFSTTLIPDKTLTGGQTNTAGFCYMPLCVTANTRKQSYAFAGDSRLYGTGDTAPGLRGNIGEAGRSVGTAFAWINMGSSSATYVQAVASYTKRAALITSFCTDVIVNYGINDISAGQTNTQMQANTNTFIGLFPTSIKVWVGTISPRTSGAWTLPDGSDQTLLSGESNRLAYNVFARAAGFPTAAGIIDFAALTEMGGSLAPTGKWNAPGYTTDGLHQTSKSALIMAGSAIINPVQSQL